MTKTMRDRANASREGLTFAKALRFLSLPFCPRSLKPYLAVNRFVDVPIDLLQADGIQGVLLDADGTLCPHHAREFSDEVIRHIAKLTGSGLKVAIYTNAAEDRFQQFSDINIVTGVSPKPNRHGFETAMEKFLGLKDPATVCMIGDNFITDGGAYSAGMRFIHVRPIKGNESFFHAFTRHLAFLCARFYFPAAFR
jgi:HAD superfamily phosphatase (TIGR01668 family)